MRTLTLWQPWASLIAIGAKRIETRSWSTSYRGQLAIHAAKKWDADLANIATSEPFLSTLAKAGIDSEEGISRGGLPRGAIVCVCRLVDVCRIHRDCLEGITADFKWPLPEEPERSFGDYTPGRCAWILDDIRPLAKPIAIAGGRSLWDWTPSVAAQEILDRSTSLTTGGKVA